MGSVAQVEEHTPDKGEDGSSRLPRPKIVLYDKANKRIWWMPRQSEAKKDVTACEKRRGSGK